MASSQNGFPALSQNSKALHRWVIPGCEREFTLRYGSAGFILTHFLMWFHQKIEPLDTGVYDDWGWAFRAVRGASDLSNHASGTAADSNAVRHPLGVHNTFTLPYRIKIRARPKLYRGCIRWGGDYNGRHDDMHFEIDRSLGVCEFVAKILLKTPRGKRIAAVNPGQREVIYQ